jgi:hypothetical protein
MASCAAACCRRHLLPPSPAAAAAAGLPCRRLEVVADAGALTASVLEVLHACCAPVQQQLIGILPEVVQPQDHGVAIEQLQALLEGDVSFMPAVVECLGNMQLEPAMQAAVLQLLASQLPAVDVEDLPGLVKYLVASAGTPSSASQVGLLRPAHAHHGCRSTPGHRLTRAVAVPPAGVWLANRCWGSSGRSCTLQARQTHASLVSVWLWPCLQLRRLPAARLTPASLLCAVPDIAAVADPRQKGALHPRRGSPEVAVVRELVAALQGNKAAEAASLQQQAGVTGKCHCAHLGQRTCCVVLRCMCCCGPLGLCASPCVVAP